MKGMDAVIQTRAQRLKPASVHVYLVLEASRSVGYLGSGMFAVEIVPADRLSLIDFRPLVGLWVVVHDKAGDKERHREACRLIAQANPADLHMPFRTDDGWCVHTLSSGETTTSHIVGDGAAALEAL